MRLPAAGRFLLQANFHNFTSYNGVYLQGTLNNTTTPALSMTRMKHTMNMKAYEQSNHLGNVVVTVSDARQVLNSGASVTGYMGIVKSASDYSSFGVTKAGRTYTSTSYRYTFNGKEKENEISLYDYGFRIYNPALARFLSVDPLSPSYPWYTPFQFAGNKPVWAMDLDGLEEFFVTQKTSSDSKIYWSITRNEAMKDEDKGKIQYRYLNKPPSPIQEVSDPFLKSALKAFDNPNTIELTYDEALIKPENNKKVEQKVSEQKPAEEKKAGTNVSNTPVVKPKAEPPSEPRDPTEVGPTPMPGDIPSLFSWEKSYYGFVKTKEFDIAMNKIAEWLKESPHNHITIRFDVTGGGHTNPTWNDRLGTATAPITNQAAVTAQMSAVRVAFNDRGIKASQYELVRGNLHGLGEYIDSSKKKNP